MELKQPRSAGRWGLLGVLLAATSVLAACDDSATGPDGDSQLIDGVLYRVSDLLIAESFPVQIGVTVELRNLSSTPRTVVFPDGCVVLMRAYSDGIAPVWDMASGIACTLALVEVRLAAGESRLFQSGLVSAATILEGGLPAGEYRITAYLRPAGIVEVEAGVVELAVP